MRFSRFLLVSFFALGQAAMAAHSHPIAKDLRVSRVSEASHELGACKTCELSSQARAGRLQPLQALPIVLRSAPLLFQAVISYESNPLSFGLARAPPVA